jgi:superfamily I DNA/RNA helicase
MDIVVKLSRLILRRSNAAAKEAGFIDFDDMVYLPLTWNLRMWQNDWVLIDEAQDTNPTRRALARKMLRPGGRLIAVGDPHQAIYGFSGADNDALSQIARDFSAKWMPLTVTYRCPKEVVKVAREFVSHIAAADTAPDGLSTEQPFTAVVDQLQPGDAVLCRYNKYLVNLCFKLIREGKPARIEGRAIGANLVALVNKWKASKLEVIADRTIAWRNREVAKAEAKQQDVKADQIRDRAETVLVLIERAMEQGITTKAELVKMITDLFDDRVVDNKNMITLCSVHRSKGLEWPRVFVLGLHELMGRECRQPWQTEQEVNLQYVAVTRAQDILVNVTGVKEEKKQHSFGEEVE